MEVVFMFIYTDSVALRSVQSALGVLMAADAYRLDKLVALCASAISLALSLSWRLSLLFCY